MLRRSRFVLPLLAVIAALAGVALANTPLIAVALGAAAGLTVELVLGRAAEERVRRASQLAARTAAEEALQDRLEHLDAERSRVERLLDGLSTAVLLFTDEGLAYANPAAQEQFSVGRTADATPLRVLGDAGLAGAVVEARETGRPVELEERIDERHVVARASVVAEGEVALVVNDVTETRRVEAVRRDFVANASHELKTPVAGMQALAGSLALAMDRDFDRARTMVERLQLEAARLARLVRDLLDLTRLEEGSGAADRQRIDLAAVVEAQVQRLAGVAAEREVEITCDCPRPASIVAIPEDVRLIVDNLIANAVQYNRRGGSVQVVVRRSGANATLRVSDNGIGIPEADQDRIFERFYRVDKARTRAAGGTGLGLSIVRNAVERHGGQVSVRSVLGQGSTFTVVLPVEGAEL